MIREYDGFHARVQYVCDDCGDAVGYPASHEGRCPVRDADAIREKWQKDYPGGIREFFEIQAKERRDEEGK